MNKPASPRAQAWYELLSSMRFAISLLTVLGVASVIGTVLRQNEPYPNYVTQFGQFWFALFEQLGLYDVYHAGWFLAILCFLVASTSLCIYRNGPLMLREMKSFREHATEKSLRLFAHHAQFEHALQPDTLAQRATAYLATQGYRSKTNALSDGLLIAAKTGSLQRLGYIFTHAAIVIICIGGLLDGNLVLKFQEWLGGKSIETRDIPQSQVPPQSRLPATNLSFRGNVTIAEGTSADVVFLNVRDGYLVQELPFSIAVKKFYIEHYSTGQPKSFASDLIVTDKKTGASFAHTITVNHPLIHDGVAIYQASFSDGGTHLNLEVWPLLSKINKPAQVQGQVHAAARLANGNAEYSIEFTDFRPFNVENVGAEVPPARGLTQKMLGSAANLAADKELRNVGPSFQYKLRDAQGQALEFNNYMLPVQIEQRGFMLSGVRSDPNEAFRYLRLPVDEQGTLESYMQLRALLFDAEARDEIARKFALGAMQGDAVSETMRSKLSASTGKILEIFAHNGYSALDAFLKEAVPQGEQEKVATIYVKILQSAVLEALQTVRRDAGLGPLQANEAAMLFVGDALNAINDSFIYGAPVYLQLADYREVKASGLQLTRSPGKNIVYTGSVLLVLGVFAMLYLRERRIWLRVKPGSAFLAMSSNRKTLDFEREFAQHRDRIAALIKE
ncbi:MAG: cytochrome c biogenesis protein ResB [Burkholderiales bacterium]